MKTFSKLIILALLSFSLEATEVSFKTSRESGKLSFRTHQLMYVTPQKSSTLSIKDCNKSVIQEFRMDILKLAKEEESKADKNIKGSISLDGRVVLLNLDSKLYEIFDNFHAEIQNLEKESTFQCLKSKR